jgi:phage recombination protein Bet
MATQELAPAAPRSVLHDMADRFGMAPQNFEATLRATIVPQNCSREQLAAFLLVAKQYQLNPITKEIFAFPRPGGGIQPVVSVDGWCNIINSHPQIGGIEFDDHVNAEGKVTAITCRIWRKDRERPVNVTEYMAECVRDTDVWKRWPRRMLRHKALIQCARYSFGFAGIVDIDEAERETYQERQARKLAPRPDLATRMKTLAQASPMPAAGAATDRPDVVLQDDEADAPAPAPDDELDQSEPANDGPPEPPPDPREEPSYDEPRGRVDRLIESAEPLPDPDYERGWKDARAGAKSCLNIAIKQDMARFERWRAGWHAFHEQPKP